MTIIDIWNATLGNVQVNYTKPIKYTIKYKNDNLFDQVGSPGFYCAFFFEDLIPAVQGARKKTYFSLDKDREEFDKVLKSGYLYADPHQHGQLSPYLSLIKCRIPVFNDVACHLYDELSFAYKNTVKFTGDEKDENQKKRIQEEIINDWFSELYHFCRDFVRSELYDNELDMNTFQNIFLSFLDSINTNNISDEKFNMCRFFTALVFSYVYALGYTNAFLEKSSKLKSLIRKKQDPHANIEDINKQIKIQIDEDKINTSKLATEIEKDRESLRLAIIEWLSIHTTKIPKEPDTTVIEKLAKRMQELEDALSSLTREVDERLPDKTKKPQYDRERLIGSATHSEMLNGEDNEYEHEK